MLFLQSIVRRTLHAPLIAGAIMQPRYLSTLGSLSPNAGATHREKRVGRGQASDLGKTSGRGQKGQKARGKVPFLFEGGQTRFFKRFPKIGFYRKKREYHELKLSRIQDFWDNGRIPLDEGSTLTIQKMREVGLITGSLKNGVEILGSGAELYRVPLDIEATRASNVAIEAIKKLNREYTSVYRTQLGLRAHVAPDHFLRTKGYVPMQARPTHRRDIRYFSREDKGGYLLKNRSILLDFIGQGIQKKKKKMDSHIVMQLQNASAKTVGGFRESKTVSLADL